MTNINDLVATTAAKNIKGACSNDQSATRDYLTAPLREHLVPHSFRVTPSILTANDKLTGVCARRAVLLFGDSTPYVFGGA